MIVSIRQLSFALGVPAIELKCLAKTSGRYYTEFSKLKPNGTSRIVKHSTGRLKEVQGLIYKRLLKGFEFGPELHGVPGGSVEKNAVVHVGNRVVANLDIQRFYPSIRPHHVFNVWRSLGYSPALSRLLTQLTTFERELPMGNPPSTALANMVMFPVDKVANERCCELGCAYTRYVDDITISGDRSPDAIQDLISRIQSLGFKVGRSKTKVQRSHNGPQKVTGLVVNSTKRPTVEKKYRSELRRAIRFMKPGEIRSLCGRLYRVRRCNPGSYKSLVDYGRSINPGLAWPKDDVGQE